MEDLKIEKIVEVSSGKEATHYLDEGWVLLSTGFVKGEVPGYDYHSYSLGYPKTKAVLNQLRDETKNKALDEDGIF
ncbi:hypothetical protein SAMN05192534_1249 [Alteribacillus persepolensis]|uniref:Uncharacterized protein n=1 Tax=Alteribacillus persepolensis TaxID=568899 RepID=A0A1G8IH93_9BACI|nr:hypothetical protein [Alteribacillus persepolensis]SDI17900.1 hypothetical protein SAMN05192534_1249 [Alteribacillus persepolensis]